MDIPWGDPLTKKFVSNVGLITSVGPVGSNVMAAEWTYLVSYSPAVIAVSIHNDHATKENIAASKEFGVSIAATDQNVAASVAGSSSGRDVDKISLLKELGFSFRKAGKINALLLDGAAFNAECRVMQEISVGERTIFLGEIVDAVISSKAPLAYHAGKYFAVGQQLQKPSDGQTEKISLLTEKFGR